MKKILQICILLLLLPCYTWGYNFVVDSVYYNVTNRLKRTVEVTHWEEQTGQRGVPQPVCHHHDCSHDHTEGHMTRQHLKLIQLDEEAAQRRKRAYIGKVNVPAKVRYKGITYKVIGIGDGSFWGRKQLTDINLPATIRYIGDGAFENCVSLRTISLPSEVKRIGFAAFRRCMALEQITLSDSLQAIDLYAFAFCESLTEITIPTKVNTFYGNAFFHCIRLRTIHLWQAVPPLIINDVGLKMNLGKFIFSVPNEALSLYQDSEFWRALNVQAQQ